jgi:hypothetical protein
VKKIFDIIVTVLAIIGLLYLIGLMQQDDESAIEVDCETVQTDQNVRPEIKSICQELLTNRVTI